MINKNGSNVDQQIRRIKNSMKKGQLDYFAETSVFRQQQDRQTDRRKVANDFVHEPNNVLFRCPKSKCILFCDRVVSSVFILNVKSNDHYIIIRLERPQNVIIQTFHMLSFPPH